MKIKSIIVTFVTIFFVSCGGGSSKLDNPQTTKGVVYDDLVENLDYVTFGHEGRTNWKGEFLYKKGKVDFYLGKLKIGSVPTMPFDRKVFLSDMLNLPRGNYKNKQLVKLARLIQSFDISPEWTDKIVLDVDTINSIFDHNQTLDNVDLNALPIKYLVSESDAKARVVNTYIKHAIKPLE